MPIPDLIQVSVHAPPGLGADASALGDHLSRIDAAMVKGDLAGATALERGMWPTDADLRAVVGTGPAVEAFLQRYPAPPVPERPVFVRNRPEQTELRVYAASTEELLAGCLPPSPCADGFPGGMKAFGPLAAPGRTWLVAKFVEPGESLGMSFAAFTRLGERIVFVGKPWRAIPDPQ
jgi:hypothetical protein